MAAATVILLGAIAQNVCNEECSTSNDGNCDDGGPGSTLAHTCVYGSDCMDCGSRLPPSVECNSDLEQNVQLIPLIGFLVVGVIASVFAATYVSAAHQRLFYKLWLVALLAFALAAVSTSSAWMALFVDEQCVESATDDTVILWGVVGALALGCALLTRCRVLVAFRKRIQAIEGDLPARIEDGSLRLLRVAWLLERPADWVLQRQQDLPEEAFWSPPDAARLLHEEKVAALSYKWQGPFNSSKGGGDQPDGKRFHLDVVLEYYRHGLRADERPALLWDFAAIPQHNPLTGEKRTEAETGVFVAGLGVMTNVYSSPRVLVLQHRRIPPHLEQELDSDFGGKPPSDRLDLIPYAGKYCRSGWCTSESACALLMTEGGGHVYELGVGKAPVVQGWLPSEREMEAVFKHETTRFIGKADRDVVKNSYLQLRAKLEAYDRERVAWVVKLADFLMTTTGAKAAALRVFFWVLCPSLLFLFPFLMDADGVDEDTIAPIIIFSLAAIVWAALFTRPSRILRAHRAAVRAHRPRDSLEYTFQWSVIQPPVRKRAVPMPMEAPVAADDSGGELELPDCLLPSRTKQPMKRSMTRAWTKRVVPTKV